jgi:hypothetical protein
MPESKGENRMIKQIIKSLKENLEVTDWLISETAIESSQAFYVLQKLETTRVANTCEYFVTVYHRFKDNGTDYLGSSSFAVSHKLRKNELAEKISEAVFASKFIKNKTYNLVNGEKENPGKKKNMKTHRSFCWIKSPMYLRAKPMGMRSLILWNSFVTKRSRMWLVPKALIFPKLCTK